MTEKEKPIFVTDDQAIHKQRRIDPVDASILESTRTGKGLIEIKSVDQLKDIAEGLVETFNMCVELCRLNMTLEQARIVRQYRVDEGYSWRAVAHACHDLKWWPPDEYWDRVPSAQPMGMALCEVAAKFFNENDREPPWN